VALIQVFIPVLRGFPVSIIPPMLHTHLHVNVVLTGRTNGVRLATFRKSSAIWEIGENLIEKYGDLVFVIRGLTGLKFLKRVLNKRLLSSSTSLLVNRLKPSGNFTYHQV
jgi:hypothetical protein